MNRRDTIKGLAASGSLLALGFWTKACVKPVAAGPAPFFSVTEAGTIRAIADAIIPEGGGIGALSQGVDKFLLGLFEKCYEPEIQQNIKTQLAILQSAAQDCHGKTFADCTHLERQELLLNLAYSGIPAESDFFKLLKSETIRGFTTTEHVMTQYLEYKVIPGHYYGCVDKDALF